jgi:hypothetical protein
MVADVMKENAKASLHLRLGEACLTQLKRRSSLAGVAPGAYLDMVFRYLPYVGECPSQKDSLAASKDEVYFTTEVTGAVRQRLSGLSERQQCSLAVLAGRLAEAYLARFEHDPLDLPMVSRLTLLLEAKPRVSDADLEEVMKLSRSQAIAAQSAAFQAGWFFSRLRPLLGRIERNGVEVELTPKVVGEILLRLSSQPAA